ncbi:nischarin [Austrofundulus limnaeus]|uniref:Nischarin n=1 Tax=Austrofundulus limnaeus TaxID=52670 RepID=A0A2I4BSP0_AUSLI|nr:PREDICTED: nischarin [Austrofundulus limnaeus]
MEPVPFPEKVLERKVCVVGSELVENYTVYIIDVTDGRHRWTVKHRYSDFYDLHEKLTAEKKVDRLLLPPKKILGKNSKSLVERRQKELELYLQTLLQQFPEATPTPLACFLNFHLYEINGITAALAEELFHKGEQLLQEGEVFSLRPLQLYSVSQQLRQATPTCFTGDAKTDLGHILDFTCRLRYLKISGTRGPVGTSNIQESSLPFDLSIFKSLLHVEISDCSSQQIQGLPSLRSSLETMSVHRCTESMTTVLVPEASEFSQWEPEGAESGCPVTAVIPVWRNLTTLDLSHNCISSIDGSVKLIRKVEFLDLSYNQLSSVDNLQHLYNLVHVDLSYNSLRVLEAAHTRLGNIKTLSLAGNQLERLNGLSKLYSLVNLDLSHNQLAQLEEIRNIGALPCLEKLNLSSNPMCIIPDYRTKVLAQFGDRAAEVCLDCSLTTEKELDTVEVLKAIQKAKEAKDRMSSGDRKISEEIRPAAAAAAPPSSSSSCCSSAVASSSSSAQRAACPSQEVTSREDVPPAALPPADAAPPPQVNLPVVSLSGQSLCTQSDSSSSSSSAVCCICSSSSSSRPPEAPCSSCSATWCPLLPAHLSSFTSSSKDFMTQLSQRLSLAVKEEMVDEEEEDEEERRSDSRESQSQVDVGGLSSGSRDGYFEMGLDDSGEEPICSSPLSLPAPVPEKDDGRLEELCEKEAELVIRRVLWCCCVRVEEEEVQQKEACLVLTDQLLGLLSPDSLSTNQEQGDQNQSPAAEEVLMGLQVDLLVPYSRLMLSSCSELPDSCLSFGVEASPTRWYVFSEAEELSRTRTELKTLLQTSESQRGPDPPVPPQLLPPSLINSWELEESQGAQGGYPAHILCSSSSSSDTPPFLSDITSEEPRLLSLLFLTCRHLWVLRMDLRELVQQEASGLHQSSSSSCCRLVRVPLGSVVLDPREGARTGQASCPDPQHRHRSGHSVDLLLGGQRLLLLFPLAQNRSSFLGDLIQRRASLEGLKMVALPRPCSSCPHHGPGGLRSRGHCCCVCDATPLSSSSWDSSRLQAEDNQPSSHLVPGLSPGLKLLAGLSLQQLQSCFLRYITQSETEELRHVLWLSVVLYKSPETELTCCLMLSNESLYFLLEDSAAALSHQSVLDGLDSADPETRLSCCLSIRLSELLAVNVGLFDQYFRVVGRSADHIVCCLSRDSYGTGVFLQELMAALSLQQQLPPPEPSDQDFYSQFTNTNTGKMQNYELIHSSKVKFIYPSEEEMGDLTFIVAERKTSAASSSSSSSSSSCSFNILLYLLVFQVQTPSHSSVPSSGSGLSPVLQPRTLILTSTDMFLLDEDYVSYPLPDFAKEPPSRERYQLREARRIRDLDRVLLGYQTYPQALTLVFDDLPGPDLLCHLTMDHFAPSGEEARPRGGVASGGAEAEVQWCVFVPGADSRERLISLLARQWEALCSRELPVELTG